MSEIELTQAERDLIEERRRQIESEGWSAEHDDEHTSGEMGWAAAAYAIGIPELGGAVQCGKQFAPWRQMLWPWDKKWWKPSDRRRNLVKAGALIQAEIERLDRAEAAKASS